MERTNDSKWGPDEGEKCNVLVGGVEGGGLVELMLQIRDFADEGKGFSTAVIIPGPQSCNGMHTTGHSRGYVCVLSCVCVYMCVCVCESMCVQGCGYHGMCAHQGVCVWCALVRECGSVCVGIFTAVLSVPHLHTVLFLWNAVYLIIWLVPVPIAVLIGRPVCPLHSALLRTQGE